MSLPVAVLGGGSFGTALAVHLARIGHEVRLWDRSMERVRQMNTERRNPRYLTDVPWPDGLTATASLERAVEDVDLVVPVVPSHVMRDVASRVAPSIRPGTVVCCGSKGLEGGTFATMAEVLGDEIPQAAVTVLSGPSFAKELAMGMPTTVTVAGDVAAAEAVADLFHGSTLRAYHTHDVVGVCVGGSVKNVMAIATGISDGLGLGLNARAAIITRGLAEISRLAVHLGAEPATMMGLAGLGDLVLTCTGDLSRNRRVGLGVGAGRKLADILEELGEVAEGVVTAQTTHELALREGVEMPITSQVYRVLHEGRSAKAALHELLGRERKHEQA